MVLVFGAADAVYVREGVEVCASGGCTAVRWATLSASVGVVHERMCVQCILTRELDVHSDAVIQSEFNYFCH